MFFSILFHPAEFVSRMVEHKKVWELIQGRGSSKIHSIMIQSLEPLIGLFILALKYSLPEQRPVDLPFLSRVVSITVKKSPLFNDQYPARSLLPELRPNTA